MNRRKHKTKKQQARKLEGNYRAMLLQLPVERRLSFLRKLSTAGGNVRKEQRIRLRYEFEAIKFDSMPFSGVTCECCGRNPVRHRHHIHSLTCGGTNQQSNLIWICFDCHSEIHQWMKPKLVYEGEQRKPVAKNKLVSPLTPAGNAYYADRNENVRV